MGLNTKTIFLKDGRSVQVKELSVLARMKLQSKENISNYDIYELCLDDRGLNVLDTAGANEDDIKAIVQAVDEVNKKDIPEAKKES